MEENKKKVSSREAWRLHRRAAKLFYAERPALRAANWLFAAFKSLSPYVLIWLSAQIIGELTGARDAHRLTVLAVAAVAAASLLPLITAALERWQTVLFDNYFYINQKIYAKKMLDMDFPRLDDPKTHDDLAQIGQNENWGGYGLGRVMDVEMELPKAVFGVLGVIVLTVTLFTQRVPESAGAWTVLNHPLFIAGFVLLLALLTALSPLCEYRMAVLTAELAPLARLGNRYGFFSDMALSDRDRASDIRMYNQQDICDSYASSDMPFSANGPFAKLAWGRGGVLMIVSASVSVLFTAAAPECSVLDNFNLARYHGEDSGDIVMIGQGAGRWPTASAVLRDLSCVLRGEREMLGAGCVRCAADNEGCVHSYYVPAREACFRTSGQVGEE